MKNIERRRFLKYGARGLIAAGLAKGFFNTTGSMIELVEKPVRLPSLPAAFGGLKIAHLTDFHSSLIVSGDHIATSAQLVMEKKPDIIALTGDFISGSTKFLSGSVGVFNPAYLNKLVDALSGLSAPMGIYGVLGNHDFWSGPEAVTAITGALSEKIGVIWLRNKAFRISKNGKNIDILGVDDYWEKSYSLTKAYTGVKSSDAKILLSHNPDVNENIKQDMKIDLILAGHTHGGQVALPVIGTPFLPSPFGQKYREGLVRDGERQTYISRGIGHLLAPIRLNCPAEATVLTIS